MVITTSSTNEVNEMIPYNRDRTSTLNEFTYIDAARNSCLTLSKSDVIQDRFACESEYKMTIANSYKEECSIWSRSLLGI